MYLKQFRFPYFRQEGMTLQEKKESEVIDRNPYVLSGSRNVKMLEFQPVTIFYGGEGSEKTTLLNLIGEKLGLQRESAYEISETLQGYLSHCSYRLEEEITPGSRIITGKDVTEFLKQKKNDDSYKRMLLRGGSDAGQKANIRNHKEHPGQERAFLYYSDKLQGKGLYLLDEPEKYLSPKHQENLANIIENHARFWGCQFILVSSSPFMLAIKDAKIYDMDVSPIAEKRWTALENVRTYFEFFKNHENEFLF